MTRDEILKMEPGPELDALMAEKIMGWTERSFISDSRVHYCKTDYDIRHGQKRWSPSTDNKDAVDVMEKLSLTVIRVQESDWRDEEFDGKWTHPTGWTALYAPLSHPSSEPYYEVRVRMCIVCDTIPEAICKAALLLDMEKENAS